MFTILLPRSRLSTSFGSSSRYGPLSSCVFLERPGCCFLALRSPVHCYVCLFICFICLTTFSRHNLFQYFHFLQRSPPHSICPSYSAYNPSFRTFCCLPVAGMALAFLPGHIAPTLTLTLTELKKKKKKKTAQDRTAWRKTVTAACRTRPS